MNEDNVEVNEEKVDVNDDDLEIRETIKSVYSPSENAVYNALLYDNYIKAGTWPTDAIQISDEDAIKFSGGNKPAGKMLAMIDGLLMWVDEPPLSPDQLKADAENMKSTLRAKADAEINWRQDAVDVDEATEKEAADLILWKKYRILLMRVDTSKPEWPALPV